jgi:hypothetical protein
MLKVEHRPMNLERVQFDAVARVLARYELAVGDESQLWRASSGFSAAEVWQAATAAKAQPSATVLKLRTINILASSPLRVPGQTGAHSRWFRICIEAAACEAAPRRVTLDDTAPI